MRVLFAGTPEIAVPSLDALARSSHEVTGVLTVPDRTSGRGQKLFPSPVKQRAAELGLPVFQPDQLRGEARQEVSTVSADLLVCVAYGKFFGPRFLDLFPAGSINLHPSLLPRYRGPAPIPAPILNGDSETGVTVQAVAQEMDAGAVYLQRRVSLSGKETAGELADQLAELGARTIVEVVDQFQEGTAHATAQDESAATYTQLLRKSDGQIDWSQPARQIERGVRAYQPWPLAWTSFAGQRLNILGAELPDGSAVPGSDAADPVAGTAARSRGQRPRPGTVLRVDTSQGILVETGNGQLVLTKLQLQSRKALSWDSFLNGVHGFIGAVLGG